MVITNEALASLVKNVTDAQRKSAVAAARREALQAALNEAEKASCDAGKEFRAAQGALMEAILAGGVSAY